MCEFSSKLIAWLDNELPEAAAAAMDHHVAVCRECREQAGAFREVSHAFAVYARAVPPVPAHLPSTWLLVPSAIAAALLAVLLLWPGRFTNTKPDIQPRAEAQPPLPVVVPRKAARAIVTVRPPRIPRRAQTQAVAWTPAEPTIQIMIPADALFPPGAFPEGFGFVADLKLAADGSPGALALRP
jgi:putative zinc finger protein